jgi:sensor histidine kinase YesM
VHRFDGPEANFNERPECFSERRRHLFPVPCLLLLNMYATGRKSFLSFALLAQVTFWLVVLLFIGYISFLNFAPQQAAGRSVLILACHLVNFYVCYSFLVPHYYEKGYKAQAFVGLILFLLLLTPVRYAVEIQFQAKSHALNAAFVTRRTLPGFMLFSELSIAVIAALLRLAKSHEENKTKMGELVTLQLETELRFLKAQMSPHFLFNTINNIYSLTLTRSAKAPDALMKLSGLLRYFLYDSHGKVLLTQETEALNAYIALYQLRYEQPLPIELLNKVVRHDITIEPLLLVPLLENALKHSGVGVQPGASVVMKLETTAHKKLLVTLHNTKAQIPVMQDASGIGLANIRKRLQLAYPGAHELLIDDTAQTFTVTLSLVA